MSLMRLSLSVGVPGTWQMLLQQIGLTTVRRGKDEIGLQEIGQHENILCSVTTFALIGRALREVRGADAQGSAYDDPCLYVTYNPAEKNAPHYPVQIAEYRRLLHKQLGWDDKKPDARPTKPVKQTRRTGGSALASGVFVSSTDSRKSAAHGVGNVGSVGGGGDVRRVGGGFGGGFGGGAAEKEAQEKYIECKRWPLSHKMATCPFRHSDGRGGDIRGSFAPSLRQRSSWRGPNDLRHTLNELRGKSKDLRDGSDDIDDDGRSRNRSPSPLQTRVDSSGPWVRF